MSDKFIGYFRLVDACERAGCPVCGCLDKDSRRALDTLLYEHVTDAETRRRLRDAWGFCNWHAATLLDGSTAATGAAILFADLLRICHQRLDRLRSGPRRRLSWSLFGTRRRPRLVVDYRSRSRCPLCGALDAAEKSYLDAVVDFADDPQFGRAYERSTGLCVPHLVAMVGRRAAAAGVDTIVRATLRKWQRLREDLERFVEKHEYRNAEPITESEGASWLLASEILAGRRCLFGNHMRPEIDEPQRMDTGQCEPPQTLAPSDFARGKLELRVQELTRQLSDESTRAAALHYRFSRVAEDRNALELNLAGERGANPLAERALADLQAENERLRADLAKARREATLRAAD